MNWQILKDQILALTIANMKSRYRNTISGIIWVILNPIIMYGAQSYAFNHILKLNIPNFNLFLLLGLLPWLFISQSILMSATMLVNSGALLKSYSIHPFVVVASQVLDNMFNFALAFMLILIPSAFFSDIPLIRFVWLIIPATSLVVSVISLCWLISVLNVFFRDTAFVMTFILNVSFFLTPIFYQVNMINDDYRWIVKFNIFHLIISPFQNILASQDQVLWESIMVSVLVAMGLATTSFLVWKWRRNELFRYL